jgi:hypothetical protein
VTEAEWLAATDPQPMLEFLRGRVSDRKLRLFAVACCRRFGNLIVFDQQRLAIQAAEKFADGKLAGEAMTAAAEALNLRGEDEPTYAIWNACQRDAHQAAASSASLLCICAGSAIEISLENSGPDGPEMFGTPEEAEAKERAFIVQLIHDIFGVSVPRKRRAKPKWLEWNARTVLRLALAIYEDSAMDNPPMILGARQKEAARSQAALVGRYSLLADAVEDAGCIDGELLGHLRGPGPHVRGCWAMSQAEVEALLGPPADLCTGPLLDNGYADCVPDGPRPLGEYRPSCRESMSGLEWDRAEWRSDTHVAYVRYLPPGTVYDATIVGVLRPAQPLLDNLLWRAKRQWRRWFPE